MSFHLSTSIKTSMDAAREQTRSSKHVLMFVLTVNLLAVSGGITLGWTSPILPKLTNPNRTDENPIGHVITKNQESWITAILFLGSLISVYPLAVLADCIGRKRILVLVGLVMLVSYILLAASTSVALYITARFAMGFAFGGVLSNVFIYIGEISDVENRGKLLSFYTNFFTFGLLFSYGIAPYLSIMVFNFIAAMIPGLFLCHISFAGVESPTYLLKRNKRRQAYKILRKLRIGTDESVERDLKIIENEIRTNEEGAFKHVISDKALIKGLTISVALVVFEHLSGVVAVLSYSESIFEDAGSSLSKEVSAIIIGVVHFLASFLAPIFVDCAGRRILLIFSASGMIITEVALGTYFYVSDNTKVNVANISWVPILLIMTFIISYSCGFAILPYTIMGEIFPSRVRSVAAATTIFICAIVAFLVAMLFRETQGWIGNAGTFWLFGGFCILALVFIVLFVPETKGKSFEQIHQELRR